MSVGLDDNLTDQIASQIKTQGGLADLSHQLLKVAVERVIVAEPKDYLGYARHSPEDHHSGNSRNEHFKKKLKGDFAANLAEHTP